MKITIENNHGCDIKQVLDFLKAGMDDILSKGTVQFYVVNQHRKDTIYANIYKTKTSLSIKINP